MIECGHGEDENKGYHNKCGDSDWHRMVAISMILFLFVSLFFGCLKFKLRAKEVEKKVGIVLQQLFSREISRQKESFNIEDKVQFALRLHAGGRYVAKKVYDQILEDEMCNLKVNAAGNTFPLLHWS